MNADESHRADSCEATPKCLMRRYLPSEYLAMALMMHASLGVAAWTFVAWLAPEGLVLVAAGLWIIGRSVGTFSGRWYAPLVTSCLCLVVGALYLASLELPHAGLVVFSPLVFLLMLSVILAADLVELVLLRPF